MNDRMNGRLNVVLLAGLLVFSWWSVYTRYVDLHAFDLVTNMPFHDLSMQQYDDTLAGTRKFPYQWRVLGFWVARAGVAMVPVDPHAIDVVVKTLSLAAATACLYGFATTLVSPLGAVLSALTFLFVTAARLRLKATRSISPTTTSRSCRSLRACWRCVAGSGGGRRSPPSAARGRKRPRC